MRFETLWLDGYGRFTGLELSLHPGLQIVFGPNEQGKSTLRGFIGDMLYGQKRSTRQKLYENSNELRRPWHGDTYAGRMVYRLDNGRRIEVRRVFDRDDEAVEVFDLSEGRDITGVFDRFANKEVRFAETHLGLTKAVFLNTASIGHLGLTHLGAADSLDEIKEKVLGLADAAEEGRSAVAAVARLNDRIAAIGRPNARTRPLPAARRRLDELAGEAEAVRRALAETAQWARERIEALEEARRLRDERDALRQALEQVELRERAARLAEAERIAADMQALQEKCFALSHARAFPLEQAPDLQRAENDRSTARMSLQKVERAIDETTGALEQARSLLARGAEHDVPPDAEERLTELAATIRHAVDRLQQSEQARDAAREREAAARNDLGALPDFSAIPGDPLEAFNQLAGSFRMHANTRDSERRDLAELREELAGVEARLAAPEALFTELGDAGEWLREARDDAARRDQAIEQKETRRTELAAELDALQAGVRPQALMAGVSALVAAGFTAVAVWQGLVMFWLPAALGGLGMLYFISQIVNARADARKGAREAEELANELDALAAESAARQQEQAGVLRRVGCETLRELEARYEQYRVDTAQREALRKRVADQTARAREEEEHTARLFDHVAERFRAVGQDIAGEDQVEAAAQQVLVDYQSWRDARRRAQEARQLAERHAREAAEAEAELREHQAAERAYALEMRSLLRQAGFPEEAKHDSALAALKQFRIRAAQWREQQGRVDTLEGRLRDLEAERESDRAALAEKDARLARLLGNAGVDSPEAWRARAEDARAYRAHRDRRKALQEQLDVVLQGHALDDLRAAVAAQGPLPDDDRSPDEIREAIDRAETGRDAQEKAAHALELRIRERMAGVRTLSEVEEEQALVQARVDALSLEFDAAAYAAAAIEQAARDKYTRIAPRLGQRAGDYLREITGDRYSELHLSRDMAISVRLPGSERIQRNPETRLSKGTVDQIYLSLRLALVQSISETGETVPMLLDDPFANYDDARLARALQLLHRLAAEAQVLVFTCREDVVEAATAAGAPVIRLQQV